MNIWDHLDRWFAPVCGIAIVIVSTAFSAINWSHGQDVGFWSWAIMAVFGVFAVTWELSRLYHAIDTVWGTLDDVLKYEDPPSPKN